MTVYVKVRGAQSSSLRMVGRSRFFPVPKAAEELRNSGITGRNKPRLGRRQAMGYTHRPCLKGLLFPTSKTTMIWIGLLAEKFGRAKRSGRITSGFASSGQDGDHGGHTITGLVRSVKGTTVKSKVKKNPGY